MVNSVEWAADGSDASADEVEAIVAGHICLDLIPTLGGAIVLEPGGMIAAGPAVAACGGVVANTGLALTRLGVATRLIGKVGDDLFGRSISEKLDEVKPGLSRGLVVSPDGYTSYTVILSSPDTDRMFVHAPGCNDTFASADIADCEFERTRIVHFGYPPLMRAIRRDDGAELVSIMRRAKEAGATTSLDFSMPAAGGESVNWRRLLANVLPYVDVAAPNIEELLCILRPDDYRSMIEAGGRDGILSSPRLSETIGELAQELLAMGAAVAAIKAGHLGLRVQTGGSQRIERMGRAAPANPGNWSGREICAPCFRANVVGTTGSGDATVAGLLMGLLRGMAIEDAANAGCAVGAFCVEAPDAQSGVRSWSETESRIEAGWVRLPAAVDADRWRWDEGLSVWLGPNDATRETVNAE